MAFTILPDVASYVAIGTHPDSGFGHEPFVEAWIPQAERSKWLRDQVERYGDRIVYARTTDDGMADEIGILVQDALGLPEKRILVKLKSWVRGRWAGQ